METEMQRGAIRDERRAYAKALLARYPDLPIDQLNDLLRWFRKEASALDVGSISMDDEVSQQYALLKRDELDRFAMPDIVFMLLFWSAMCAIIGGIGYLGSRNVEGPEARIPSFRAHTPSPGPAGRQALQPLAKRSCLCPV